MSSQKKNSIYQHIFDQIRLGKKLFAVLIDPDTGRLENLSKTISLANASDVDLILVGGSLLLDDVLGETIRLIQSLTNIPVVIFPGNHYQIDPQADAILLLSMISGRNPDLLIGQHVMAAPKLQKSNIEILPTGYMLIDGGLPSREIKLR